MTSRPPSTGAFHEVPDPRPVDEPWREMSWPPAREVLVGFAVTLVPLEPGDDSDELFSALDHDTVWRHVPGRVHTPAAFGDWLAARRAQGRHFWAVRLLAPDNGGIAGPVVGLTAYMDVSQPDARLEIGSTLYAPYVWGTAVNPDAKLLLLAYAFDALGAGRVQFRTDVRNERSQRAIDRLGATFEGVLRRHQRRDDGTVRDTAVFSILAEEWPAVRAGLLSRLILGQPASPRNQPPAAME